jgi:3',5'-cyclic-nucleotide phosphodiesterase
MTPGHGEGKGKNDFTSRPGDREKPLKIEILGCDGAPAPGRLPMTLLVDSTLLVDAGSAVSGLDPSRAPAVRAVLLTHAHLDHIRELGFLPFHRDGERDGRLAIWATAGVLDAVRTAVFNRKFWVDFEDPRPPRKAGIAYRTLSPGDPVEVEDVTVEAVPTTHSTYETSGFLLEKGDACVAYAVDSGPTDEIWEKARNRAALRAAFFDVSFPNRFAGSVSEHLTPRGLRAEVEKLLPRKVRVIAVHLKPEFREETIGELTALPFPVEIPGNGEALEF